MRRAVDPKNLPQGFVLQGFPKLFFKYLSSNYKVVFIVSYTNDPLRIRGFHK